MTKGKPSTLSEDKTMHFDLNEVELVDAGDDGSIDVTFGDLDVGALRASQAAATAARTEAATAAVTGESAKVVIAVPAATSAKAAITAPAAASEKGAPVPRPVPRPAMTPREATTAKAAATAKAAMTAKPATSAKAAMAAPAVMPEGIVAPKPPAPGSSSEDPAMHVDRHEVAIVDALPRPYDLAGDDADFAPTRQVALFSERLAYWDAHDSGFSTADAEDELPLVLSMRKR